MYNISWWLVFDKSDKEKDLSKVTFEVGKMFPDISIPPKVVVSKSGSVIYPPTIADDTPNRILVVKANEAGKLELFINASDSVLLNWKL